jgi:hypothetical protein
LAAAVGDGSEAFAQEPGPLGVPGTGNVALALGTQAEAIAAGTGNLAVAVGNPGANPGFDIDGHQLISSPASEPTTAVAAGAFNRAFVAGNGSTAYSYGGDQANPLTSVGNNTAVTLGDRANSYAGERPFVAFPPGATNTPNNSFAFAGPGKNAINAVNP